MRRSHKAERHDHILEAVVGAFIETGEPVSSAWVARHSDLGISPASIRSTMKELEEEGFLYQPHTSAGRVPTVKGYRYYVRYLMPDMVLPDHEKELVRSMVERIARERDADMVMEQLALVLSEVTDLIGVAMAPSFNRGVFDRLEIVDIGASRYLFVVTLRSGVVKTITLRVEHMLHRLRIEETARLITARLSGVSISEIKQSIGVRLNGVGGGDPRLIDVVLDNSDALFRFDVPGNVHVAGLSRLFSHQRLLEGDYPTYSMKLVDIFEDKGAIAEALDRTSRDSLDLAINIGGREPWGAYPPLSMVSAGYRSELAGGAIGVIGPAHICYPKLSAVVRYAATVTTDLFAREN